MRLYRDLDVLDAAELVADQVNQWLARTQRALHRRQLEASVQSIGANIAEGFGRGSDGPDRVRFLRYASGSAEEAIRHLSANYRAKRIEERDYWSARNRLIVITRMIDGLVKSWKNDSPPG